MTAIVGVLCNDGVVIGADSSATFVHGQHFRTIEQPTEKLDIIEDHIILVGTGPIGLGQRFSAIIKKLWENNTFRGSALDVSKELTRVALQDLQYTGANIGLYGALVAFPVSQRAFLCEFALQDFQPEIKNDRLWYCSMGCAQPIMDPFLALMRDIFWQEGLPNLQDGILAATWTLDHAIAINPGGVNGPVRIAVLERVDKGKLKARKLEDSELFEHRQHIDEIKSKMRDFIKNFRATDTNDIPEIPKP